MSLRGWATGLQAMVGQSGNVMLCLRLHAWPRHSQMTLLQVVCSTSRCHPSTEPAWDFTSSDKGQTGLRLPVKECITRGAAARGLTRAAAQMNRRSPMVESSSRERVFQTGLPPTTFCPCKVNWKTPCKGSKVSRDPQKRVSTPAGRHDVLKTGRITAVPASLADQASTPAR